MKLEISDLQRLNLQPGDRLVVRVKGRLSAQEADILAARLREWSGGEVSVLVLDDGASLEVVAAEDDAQEIVR